jgi:ferrous iron transport protein A
VIRKLSDLALGGPVVVLVNRAQVAIGRGMARRILLRLPVAAGG